VDGDQIGIQFLALDEAKKKSMKRRSTNEAI
jgi:hypothetical protein